MDAFVLVIADSVVLAEDAAFDSFWEALERVHRLRKNGGMTVDRRSGASRRGVLGKEQAEAHERALMDGERITVFDSEVSGVTMVADIIADQIDNYLDHSWDEVEFSDYLADTSRRMRSHAKTAKTAETAELDEGFAADVREFFYERIGGMWT